MVKKKLIIYVKIVPSEKEIRDKMENEQMKKLVKSLKVKDRVKIRSAGNGL